MTTPVLLPAGFVRLGAERFFLSVADGFNPACAHACRGQSHLHGTGAAISQGQVVFGRTTLIAMSLDREVDVGMSVEELRISCDRALLIRADRFAVVVKIDILDARSEQILFRRSGAYGRGRRWSIDGYACRGILRPSRALGYEMVGGRVSGCDLLRSTRIHRTDTID